jgi:hypothetical protein
MSLRRHPTRARIAWVGFGAAAVLLAGSAAALTAARHNKAATKAGQVDGGGTGTVGAGNDNGNNGNGGNGGNGNGDNPKGFTISGSLTGLYPGASKPLVLTVTNPNNQAITVQSLTVTPHATGGCTAGTLTTGPFTAFQVPGRSSATTSITIRMSGTAGDACKGVSWPLTYSGTAVKA